ncbi:MAG TPA: zinc metallopeptidase, partial [Clostridia bacterium]|nr:zinc metallopeptidase [Clostridia bacterium]
AIQALDRGILDQAELNGTKRVLWAAAMTYVAALALSIAQLLRLLLLTRGRRD